MNLIYCDPGLMDNQGHHANSCRLITTEARQRGIPTGVLAHIKAEPPLCGELSATPWFRCHTYGIYSEDPICGFLLDFDFISRITKEDLFRVRDLGSVPLVYLNSLCI